MLRDQHFVAIFLEPVEEGGATVIVGDKRAVAGPRSIVFIPRDTWISTANTGKSMLNRIWVLRFPQWVVWIRAWRSVWTEHGRKHIRGN